MRITLYRHQRAVFQGRVLRIHWDEYTFDPVEFRSTEVEREWRDSDGSIRLTQFTQLWTPVAPVEVEAPVGSSLVTRLFKLGRKVEGSRRLATYFDPFGLTAESVYGLARGRRRGFAVCEATDTAVAETVLESHEKGDSCARSGCSGQLELAFGEG